jgi:hypothetical protein
VPIKFNQKAIREAFHKKAKNLPSNIVAIEGSWDGDSGGWYACLSAIEKIADEQYKEHLIEGCA